MTRRTLFLIGLLLELAAIFGLFVPYEMIRTSGTSITLGTVPVDPRSIFRGEYVILDYEAGAGMPISDEYGKPVYIILEKKEEVFERVRIADQKPTLKDDQVCLQGRREYNRTVFPDIAQYFVEEGTGREIEQAINWHRLFVDAVVSDNCRAVLSGIRLGQEVPENELPDWARDQGIPPVPAERPLKPVPVQN